MMRIRMSKRLVVKVIAIVLGAMTLVALIMCISASAVLGNPSDDVNYENHIQENTKLVSGDFQIYFRNGTMDWMTSSNNGGTYSTKEKALELTEKMSETSTTKNENGREIEVTKNDIIYFINHYQFREF